MSVNDKSRGQNKILCNNTKNNTGFCDCIKRSDAVYLHLDYEPGLINNQALV